MVDKATEWFRAQKPCDPANPPKGWTSWLCSMVSQFHGKQW